MSSFGERAGHLRELNGFTLQQIADLFGYSRNAPSYWEDGKREPSYEDLVRLAAHYGVTTDYLLGVADADRDSVAMRKVKSALFQYLALREGKLCGVTPVGRVTLVFRFLSETAPEHYALQRVAAQMGIKPRALERLLSNEVPITPMNITTFAGITSVEEQWFWLPEPNIYRTRVDAWLTFISKAAAAGITPEAAEELLQDALRKARTPK